MVEGKGGVGHFFLLLHVLGRLGLGQVGMGSGCRWARRVRLGLVGSHGRGRELEREARYGARVGVGWWLGLGLGVVVARWVQGGQVGPAR